MPKGEVKAPGASSDLPLQALVGGAAVGLCLLLRLISVRSFLRRAASTASKSNGLSDNGVGGDDAMRLPVAIRMSPTHTTTLRIGTVCQDAP